MNRVEKLLARPGLTTALALALLLPAASARAQRFEVTPFAGYQVGGELTRTSLGHNEIVDAEDSGFAGVTFGYAVSHESLFEVTYSRQPTQLALAPGEESPDLNVQYLLAGGSYHWGTEGKLEPFVQLSVGAAHFTLAGYGSDTRFASAFGGGVRLFLSQRFAVRFDGRLLSTYTPASGGVFCAPGVCYGYLTSAWMNQFAFSAGLVARF
jgi:hypothetical protein